MGALRNYGNLYTRSLSCLGKTETLGTSEVSFAYPFLECFRIPWQASTIQYQEKLSHWVWET